jgi:hypothetical protein
VSNYYLGALGCVDQYRVCNPTNKQCTAFVGSLQLYIAAANLSFNSAQQAAFRRIHEANQVAGTAMSVGSLGGAGKRLFLFVLCFECSRVDNLVALLARETVSDFLSSGLPSNQWTLEVTRWFTTSLAKIQASVVQYASNEQDLGPYGRIRTSDEATSETPEVRNILAQQCGQQRIQSSNEVQSFSVLGLGIVVGSTLLLIVVSLSLDSIVEAIRKLRGDVGPRSMARQADDQLHLLRMSLVEKTESGLTWINGALDTPLTEMAMKIDRPSVGYDGLSSYPYGVK